MRDHDIYSSPEAHNRHFAPDHEEERSIS
jgi:hypothetical protein